MSAYSDLESRFHRLYALRNAVGMLQWDMATMMPSGGAAARSEQLAALNVTCHGILADPATGELLAEAESDDGTLNDWQRANLAEMRRQWIHATALDSRLVEALTKATNACELVWRKARPAADYGMVKPALKVVLSLVREAAQAKAARLDCTAYDALLDEYEPGGSSADIDPVFDDLAAFLPPFRERVMAHQNRQPQPTMLRGPFALDKQRELGERVMRAMGFDFEHGRLDTSLHPFCGGVPDDVRITTRYDEGDFAFALMGVIHETGHALYERGLPAEWRHQPVGQARGMSVHESQSLLMEMQACRSRPFIEFMAPLAREVFDADSASWSEDNLHRAYIRVRPDFIRVNADEVTYPAHVILRYRLEKALIAGDMTLDDLPAAWNAGMRELLGITPPTDREGCLQDIHWYDGAWGYFPTYTLGAMTAAQLYDAACRAHPKIPTAIRQGDFSTLLGWLRKNIHSHGSCLSTHELLTQATGRALDPAIFKRHLEQRYLA
ncbi:MAG: carboxypeptidase M32 [Dongiaceae bacterium]